jgi:5'-nucleotidase
MRILVTNDDGIAAKGIFELAAVAAETDHEVVIAAPSGERSGSSASLIAVESEAGVKTEAVGIGSAPGASAFGVHASPALIAVMASTGAFGDPFDLVLSGINHGPNTGASVLHSGTVGAAFTAVSHGIPAVAFSSVATKPESWLTATVVARHVVAWATTTRPPTIVLNVNIPDVPLSALRGIRTAHLAAFGAAQARIKSPGRKSTVTVSEAVDPPEPDSDDALLAAGWATVTPVAAPYEIAAELPGLPTGPFSPARRPGR